MNIKKFEHIVFENFKDISNDENESLIVSLFRDLNEEYIWYDEEKLFKYLEGHITCKKHIDFIKSNISRSIFVEPFQHWSDIPDWYLMDFSWHGLVFTTSKKRNYYLPKFLIQSASGNFLVEDNIHNLSEFAWQNHLLPDISASKYPINQYYNDFDKLSEEQKSVVAFYLVHHNKDGELSYDPFDEHEYPHFWEYWHPHLKNFDKLI